MKVFELAKELNTSSDVILETLKSLKFKAVDRDQKLNKIVVSILKKNLTEEKKAKLERKFATRISRVDPRAPKVIEEDEDQSEEVKEKSSSENEVKEKPAVAEEKAEEKPKDEPEPPKKKTKAQILREQDRARKEALAQKYLKEQEEKKKKEEAKAEKKKAKQENQKTSDSHDQQDKGSDSRGSKRKSKGGRVISDDPLITLAKRKGKPVPPMQPVRPRGGGRGRKKKVASLPQFAQQVTEVKEPSYDEIRDIELDIPITVKELCNKIQQKPSLIMTHLMKMGLMVHVNQSLEQDIVEKLIENFGFTLTVKKTQEEQMLDTHLEEKDDPDSLKQRAPVVTFMGHVDHGKTSLLDKIREAKVADGEHGGITQHMGAYSVEIEKGSITFLDTPGHAAFTAMRARSAHITDVVVLVVAADDGIKPQTIEAIDHARAAGVPIIVAANKIDKPNIDMDRLKSQLSEHDLAPEDWGGKTVIAPVSALTGEGIDELLEMILLESEILELKANPDRKASGIVVEAHLSQGKGAISTFIVQNGTLREGDFVVVGPYYGKIRAMYDSHHDRLESAGPSAPAEVLGLADVPGAGETFYVVEDEKTAREIADKRHEEMRNEKLKSQNKLSLEDFMATQAEGEELKELPVLVKSDVQGSLEALIESLKKIPDDKARLKFIHTGVGEINASDVLLAQVSKAIIIAFHVGVNRNAQIELEKDPVEVREYNIIYDVVDDIRNAMEGMLDVKFNRVFKSRIEVRQVFKLSKQGVVAGSYVTKGKAHRKDHVDVIRGEETIFSGKISSLKRFKDDVKEVGEGFECGVQVEGFDDFNEGDILETYELERVKQTL